MIMTAGMSTQGEPLLKPVSEPISPGVLRDTHTRSGKSGHAEARRETRCSLRLGRRGPVTTGRAPPGMRKIRKRTREVFYNQQKVAKTNLKRT